MGATNTSILRERPHSHVPAGEFGAKQVTLIDAINRHLLINFHPDWPGLILSATYEKRAPTNDLTMTHFNPAGGNAP